MNDDEELPKWMSELQEEMVRITREHEVNSLDLLVFLSSTISGQFVLCGLSEEGLQAVFEKMLEAYRDIKKSGVRMDGQGRAFRGNDV